MANMIVASFKTLSVLPLFALALAPFAVMAQSDPDEIVMPGGVLPAGAVIVPQNPADALTFNLNILARNPRDLTALTQAGISALAVGDANAAIGFLGRAEQLSPTNGRIKLSLGTALVMLERPADALHFFDEAASFGVSEREIARDRGLAWDLKGDPRRAQQDYALALRYGSDDEVTRRMALSYGISGDRDHALKLLEPLIRRQDQASWRNRAFILAMNGDEHGAERIVEQVMPYGVSNSMTPFLRRLSGLGPADRARAVNFGTMPAQGVVQTAMIDPDSSFRAINGRVADGLIAPPAPLVTLASVEDRRDTDRKRRRERDRRRPGHDQDGVLIAAVTSPLPAPMAPAAVRLAPVRPETPPAAVFTPFGRPIQRLAPVDPALLPPEARPVARGSEAPVVHAVLLPRDTLPSPFERNSVPVNSVLANSVIANNAPVAPPPVQVAVVQPVKLAQAETGTPPPLFELPAKLVPPPAPKPVASPPPVVQPPVVAMVQPITQPPVIKLAPAQLPVAVTAHAPLQGPPAPGFESVGVASAPAISTATPATVEPQQGLAPSPITITASANPDPPVAVSAKPSLAPEPPVSLAEIIASVETESESTAAAINLAEMRKARLKADAKVKADAK
ncbi:MAG: hypothetical protein RL367_185, partial [Pseudomonadota bacterium]